MSTLQTRSFDSIVGLISSGMQGRINSFLNFAIGTWLRGIAEAYAGVGLWFQKIGLDITKLTRLATSTGSDVDSFVADFPLSGVTRIGAVAATGLVVFGRLTAAASAPVIPVGTVVQTGDGSQKFSVYADTTNPAFSATAVPGGGYVMAAQTTSVTVPVQGITNGTTGAPGANGNVTAGAITNIGAGAPQGISTVTNTAAFANGSDAESDASVINRFHLAVAGRTGGTDAAIQSVIANIKVGMTCVILNNQDRNGNFHPGMVSVFVDDGSGSISGALLAQAQAAVATVQAAGVRVAVYAATAVLASVGMELKVATGYYRPTVVAQVTAALGLYINGLGQGVTLGYFDLPAVAKSVPGCTGIDPETYTLNGGTNDVAGTPQTTIKAGSLAVT